MKWWPGALTVLPKRRFVFSSYKIIIFGCHGFLIFKVVYFSPSWIWHVLNTAWKALWLSPRWGGVGVEGGRGWGMGAVGGGGGLTKVVVFFGSTVYCVSALCVLWGSGGACCICRLHFCLSPLCFVDWKKIAFSRASATKQRPKPFRPSKESRSWHRRYSKWRPSMTKLVGGRERLEPGHWLTRQAHALLWNDIRNTCNLWLAEGSRC